MKYFTKFIRFAIAAMLLSFIDVSTVFAHNKVVVVPMSGDDLKPLKNIITVAKENGDFSDPVAAVNSIGGNASASNPFLIVIAPGVYPLSSQLKMRQFVDIAGSGQNVTRLIGVGISGSLEEAALVASADNSTIRDLTVEPRIINFPSSLNTIVGIANSGGSPTIVDVSVILKNSGPSSEHIGIVTLSGSPNILNVTVTGSSDGSEQTGIRIAAGASSTISNTTIKLSGGSRQYGIYNDNSSVITNTSIEVLAGTLQQYGIFSVGGTTTINDSKINVSGGSENQHGIYITSIATVVMSDSEIKISRGSKDQYGYYGSASFSTITKSRISIGQPIVVRAHYGIFNTDNSIMDIRGLEIDLRSGGTQFGIHNTDTDLYARDAELILSIGTNTNVQYGILNRTAFPVIRVKPRIELYNSRVVATGTLNSYAVVNLASADYMRIDSSNLHGSRNSLLFSGNTRTRVTNSLLYTGISGDPAGVNCGGVYSIINASLVSC